MLSTEQIIIKLLMVVAVGGVIGVERELRSKSAGFRTMILICLGSFLFTTFSLVTSNISPDRIASNIVTGIGFLGAGVIFQSDNRVNGLTTAAAIWVTAGLGMGIADGEYMIVLIATAIVLVSLYLFTILETWLDRLNKTHDYKIVSVYKPDLLAHYEHLFKKYKLKYQRVKQTKNGEYIAGSWTVSGLEKNHNLFIQNILHDSAVKEFEF